MGWVRLAKVKCTAAIFFSIRRIELRFRTKWFSIVLLFVLCFTLATNTQPSAYGAYQSQVNRWPYNYNYNSYKYRNYNFQNSAANRPYNGKRRNVTTDKKYHSKEASLWKSKYRCKADCVDFITHTLSLLTRHPQTQVLGQGTPFKSGGPNKVVSEHHIPPN